MKWLLGILCLIFLILFHEFGHFIAAKLFGVKVESFSIGFGPVLFHKNLKGTDFRLSLFPLGGYCGMKGEQEFKNALETNLPYVKAEKDSLYGIHPLKRGLIGLAGPFFNLLFAFIAYTLISLIGYSYYTYSNKIILANEIYPEVHSAAKDAGLLTGDEIIKINNKMITDFSEIIVEISSKPDEDIKIDVFRNGEVLSFIVHSDFNKEDGSGKIGVSADTSTLYAKESDKCNIFQAMKNGFLETGNNVLLTLKSFKILFMGVKIQNAVSGPARVTDILGSSIKEGFEYGFKSGILSLFSLTGIISISLFIMNLLPVPILDGGLILFALIEWISRKKLNPKIQYYTQFIGLAFIIILLIFGITGDITYFINKNK